MTISSSEILIGLGLVVLCVGVLAVIDWRRHHAIRQKHGELRDRVEKLETSVSAQLCVIGNKLTGIEKSQNDTREMVQTIVRAHVTGK